MKVYYHYYYLIVNYNNEKSEDLNLKNTLMCQLRTNLMTNFSIT